MPKGDYLRGNGPKLRWIEAHVSYTGDDCLAWPFAVNERLGRGTLSVNGKVDYAYRYMCKLAHGEQPADKPYAAHECGNRHLALRDESEKRQGGTLYPDVGAAGYGADFARI